MKLKGYFFIKPNSEAIKIPEDKNSEYYEKLWQELHTNSCVQGVLLLKEDN